jgi:hypothetical protein
MVQRKQFIRLQVKLLCISTLLKLQRHVFIQKKLLTYWIWREEKETKKSRLFNNTVTSVKLWDSLYEMHMAFACYFYPLQSSLYAVQSFLLLLLEIEVFMDVILLNIRQFLCHGNLYFQKVSNALLLLA